MYPIPPITKTSCIVAPALAVREVDHLLIRAAYLFELYTGYVVVPAGAHQCNLADVNPLLANQDDAAVDTVLDLIYGVNPFRSSTARSGPG